jgi:hypothetical protein
LLALGGELGLDLRAEPAFALRRRGEGPNGLPLR